ncbi:MAG: holo-ACP synthase [Parachlamydiaceae bacterium]
MKGIGCDLIEIDRIEHSLNHYGKTFKDKIFTPLEQAYCESKKNPAQHYAVRFAAKEAVAKALGCGFGAFLSFHDVEISVDDLGKPFVTLSDQAKKTHSSPKLHLSLSHSKGLAQAVVLCE